MTELSERIADELTETERELLIRAINNERNFVQSRSRLIVDRETIENLKKEYADLTSVYVKLIGEE